MKMMWAIDQCKAFRAEALDELGGLMGEMEKVRLNMSDWRLSLACWGDNMDDFSWLNDG